MTSKEITETIKLLYEFDKIHGACHLSTFVGYRQAKDGSHKKVTITISDFGEDAPARRYHAGVSLEGAHVHTGDGDTIKEALGSTKWFSDQQPAAPVVVVNPTEFVPLNLGGKHPDK